ncbi:MAG: DedA family protein [Bacteroidales bacterium]|nr:DedA family protein [Bacteroidales bacterium]
MGITEWIVGVAVHLISVTGYVGVFVLMAMESMFFPVPSEAVMPFAGFNISDGTMHWWGVLVASTLGSIVGSSLSYAIGYWGGIPLVKKYGRYFLIEEKHLQLTERFFQKYGAITIFVCRFIPVIRHVVSIPAGTGKMNFLTFIIMTAIGATMWNMFLAWAGFELRQRWSEIMHYSHIVDLIVLAVILLIIAYYAYKIVKSYTKKSYGN